MRRTITTDTAPAAIGPYSQAVRFGNMMFISGQIPLTAQGELKAETIEEQTRQVLENLQAILHSENLSLDNVCKTTVLLQDMNDFAAMNAVYGEFFHAEPPARAAFQVSRLPKDVMVEIEAIACIE